jgi:serine/threonine protein kinase
MLIAVEACSAWHRSFALIRFPLRLCSYPKIVDFGFAKPLEAGEKTFTTCGSPDYMAPETLLTKGHDHAVDIWALGVLVFEMLVGEGPFFDDNPLRTARKITKVAEEPFEPPDFFVTENGPEAVDLVKEMLHQVPEERLGYEVYGSCPKKGSSIRDHKWFKVATGMENKDFFQDVISRTFPAPFVPEVADDRDVSNFEDFDDYEEEFTPHFDDGSGWSDGW